MRGPEKMLVALLYFVRKGHYRLNWESWYSTTVGFVHVCFPRMSSLKMNDWEMRYWLAKIYLLCSWASSGWTQKQDINSSVLSSVFVNRMQQISSVLCPWILLDMITALKLDSPWGRTERQTSEYDFRYSLIHTQTHFLSLSWLGMKLIQFLVFP